MVMGTFADFQQANADILSVMGDPAAYLPVSGQGGGSVQALLNRETAVIGEFGQTVAYRPSIAVLRTAVPAPGAGDTFTFPDGSRWAVVRPADGTSDGIVTTLWVEAQP